MSKVNLFEDIFSDFLIGMPLAFKDFDHRNVNFSCTTLK